MNILSDRHYAFNSLILATSTLAPSTLPSAKSLLYLSVCPQISGWEYTHAWLKCKCMYIATSEVRSMHDQTCSQRECSRCAFHVKRYTILC